MAATIAVIGAFMLMLALFVFMGMLEAVFPSIDGEKIGSILVSVSILTLAVAGFVLVINDINNNV